MYIRGLQATNVTLHNDHPLVTTGGSFYFTLDDEYLRVPASSDWAVRTNDFTIEWFHYQFDNDAGAFPRIFTIGSYPSSAISVHTELDNFIVTLNGVDVLSTPLPSGWYENWHHYAVVRASGQLTVYQDGVALKTVANSTDVTNMSDYLYIGADLAYQILTRFHGALTNFHFVNGTAIYTGNFTPPHSPIQPISASKLLLLAKTPEFLTLDSSGTNKIVYDNSSAVIWQPDSPFTPS